MDASVSKLWILRPREDLPAVDDPWQPWFDKCFGMIVESASEAGARQIAHRNCVSKDETELRDREVYLNPKYTRCEELRPIGQDRFILADFHDA